MRPWPKFFAFPALALGGLLAILFFRIYGPATRPEVPKPIELAVDHFAPGVAIGKSVAESSKLLSKLTYTQHVGFIGTPLGGGDVKQVRLLLGPRDRSLGGPDQQVRVDAVELLSMRGTYRGEVMAQLAGLFRGAPPKLGCITPSREGMPYRDVQYWTTKNDRGGAAFMSDWSIMPRAPVTAKSAAVWSMLFWTGPFRGQYTLRGDFQPKPCIDVVPKK